MTLFVWHSEDYMTDNYHSAAGVVVIADSLDRARELAVEQRTYRGDKPLELLTNNPDMVRDGIHGPECCLVFPDAGCC